MTVIETPITAEKSGAWQENWPAISYPIDFDHAHNKQLDPQAMHDLMVDAGIPEEEIPTLELEINNKTKEGLFGGVEGSYYPVTDNNPMRKMKLNYHDDPSKQVRLALHEIKHFGDDLEGKLEASPDHRRKVGLAVTVGYTALVETIQMKLGGYQHLDLDSLINGTLLALEAYVGTKIGKSVAGRFVREERRAYAAEKNPALTAKYRGKLYR